ncbi:MAG: glycosyltransferase family 39 protein [Chloroflexi bacterium]|nr:glycosyltransferase family 39 protein [Chloroflexota bacterium]
MIVVRRTTVRRTTVRRIGIVLLFTLVALIALNALMANFTTAMPGVVKLEPTNAIQPAEFDIFYWNLWWVKHAVFDLHVSPLYTNYVIYPFTSPLAGHTLALLWGLITAPLQDAIGLTPTFNLVVLLTFVLAATSMYAFARRHVKSQSVALLAGLMFAFTPAMLHRATLGHLDKLSIFWLPLVLWLWDKALETRRWTWALVTGVVVWFAWLTDFQQAMWALLLLGPYVVYTGFVCAQKPRAAVAGKLIAVMSAAFIIPSLFAPLPQLLAANQLNYPPARLEDTTHFAFPVQNLLTGGDNGDFSIGQLLPLLTLASVPLMRRDGRRWLWLIVALSGVLFALGPYIDLNGLRIELPYALVHRVLGYQYRTPMRFMTPAVLALTMLVALTLDQLSARLKLDSARRRASIVTLGCLFLIDYRLAEPFPITIMPDYQTYRDIANAPGDFAVLEIPIGARSGFAVVGRGETLQYYAPIHQHPIPSGYLSRLPGEIMDTFYFAPLLGALTLSHGFPPMLEVDEQLMVLLRDWNIGYVVLHRELLEAGRIRSFGNFLDRQPLLEKIGEEGPLVIYRVKDEG